MHDDNLWCTWELSFFGGPITLQYSVHVVNKIDTLLVDGYFDRGSHTLDF